MQFKYKIVRLEFPLQKFNRLIKMRVCINELNKSGNQNKVYSSHLLKKIKVQNVSINRIIKSEFNSPIDFLQVVKIEVFRYLYPFRSWAPTWWFWWSAIIPLFSQFVLGGSIAHYKRGKDADSKLLVSRRRSSPPSYKFQIFHLAVYNVLLNKEKIMLR